MQIDRSRLRVGMAVVGSDLAGVGAVKEVLDSAVLVDRELQRDVYVPFDAIQEAEGPTLVLAIPARRVDDMNWPNPPLPGEPGASDVDAEPD